MLSLQITITGPPATAITLTPVAPFSGSGSAFTAAAPLPANSIVGAISITPAGWQGVLSLSGADAGSFAISGSNLVLVGAAASPKTFNLAINANP